MAAVVRSGFVQGLAAGAIGTSMMGVALVYVLHVQGIIHVSWLQVPPIRDVLSWVYDNLGLSIPVFALVLALFMRSLAELRRRLDASSPPDEVAQVDHLTDIWTSLFFGIGVIWTAIGMRGALIYALGDPAATAQAGAFAVLQRMVDGGILLALSTTIFGGIGGYLMRVFKTVAVGAALSRYYDQAARSQGTEIHATLTAIEGHLHALVNTRMTAKEMNYGSTALGPRDAALSS